MDMMRVSRHLSPIAGIVAALEYVVAQHSANDPHHILVLLQQVESQINALIKRADNDPLLFAYQVHDEMPRLIGLLNKILVDATDIIVNTPDEIPSGGVQW